MGFQWGRWY